MKKVKNTLLKSLVLCVLLVLLISPMSAQQLIRINNAIDEESSFSAQELIENVVLGNSNCGASISNVIVYPNNTNPSTRSFGYFNKGNSNFELDAGIIISTGVAANMGNVFQLTETDISDVLNTGFDLDLANEFNLNTFELFDTSYIQFDFVPTSEEISFRYILASEEYTTQYPCDYTDPFALFIKREGENYQNIAQLPNNLGGVSVTNIHQAINFGGTSCIAINADYFAHYNPGSSYYTGPIAFATSNINGQTVVLTATATVIPGETYTLKMVLADYLDDAYDTSVFIEANSLDIGPEVNITGELEICEGGSTTLTATESDSYLWSNGETSQSITVSESGTYSVEVFTGECFATVEAEVIEVPLNLEISGSPILCNGNPTTLMASSADSYQWSNGENSQSIEVDTPGIYSVTITIDDCTQTEEIEVIVNPDPEINGNLDLCEGDSTLLTASEGDSYLWSTGETTQSITTSTSGIYTVEINNSGCITTAEKEVIVNVIELTISGNLIICDDSPTILTASLADAYLWNTGATTQSIEVSTEGTYSVTVTVGNCDKTYEVEVINSSDIIIDGEDEFCLGESTVLSALSGGTYLWSTGETTQSIEVTSSGIYSVTITYEDCVIYQEMEVSVIDNLPTEVDVIIEPDSAIIETIGGQSPFEYSIDLGISWQDDSEFLNLPSAEYELWIRSKGSFCIYKTAFIITGELILPIPNIITPNGDGINDVWNLPHINYFSGAYIYLYDRYGKIIYESEIDRNPIWDGKYLGRAVPSDSYWYRIVSKYGNIITGYLVVKNRN